jgi:hypothetical protein
MVTGVSEEPAAPIFEELPPSLRMEAAGSLRTAEFIYTT